MATKIIDTSVVIDIQRKHPPAVSWLRQQKESLILPRPAWYELVRSSNDRQELQQTLKLTSAFELIEPTPEDQQWAADQFLKYHLSHRISEHDCLIAAIARRQHCTVYTHNTKEFALLVGNLVQKSYT